MNSVKNQVWDVSNMIPHQTWYQITNTVWRQIKIKNKIINPVHYHIIDMMRDSLYE